MPQGDIAWRLVEQRGRVEVILPKTFPYFAIL
jgi:hypothetical protein